MSKKRGIRVGQAIDFGTYRQGRFSAKLERRLGEVEKEAADYTLAPIRWRVLQVIPSQNSALLIAKKCLASRVFHDSSSCPTWEKSVLRLWLNSEFFKEAFSPKEQAMILEHQVPNGPEEDCRLGKDGGPATSDRIFLLSSREARDYFKDVVDRRCSLTLLAKHEGALSDPQGDCCWWLRSPGENPDTVSFVSYGGSYSYDKEATFQGISVRPALWVNYQELV